MSLCLYVTWNLRLVVAWFFEFFTMPWLRRRQYSRRNTWEVQWGSRWQCCTSEWTHQISKDRDHHLFECCCRWECKLQSKPFPSTSISRPCQWWTMRVLRSTMGTRCKRSVIWSSLLQWKHRGIGTLPWRMQQHWGWSPIGTMCGIPRWHCCNLAKRPPMECCSEERQSTDYCQGFGTHKRRRSRQAHRWLWYCLLPGFLVV